MKAPGLRLLRRLLLPLDVIPIGFVGVSEVFGWGAHQLADIPIGHVVVHEDGWYYHNPRGQIDVQTTITRRESEVFHENWRVVESVRISCSAAIMATLIAGGLYAKARAPAKHLPPDRDLDRARRVASGTES